MKCLDRKVVAITVNPGRPGVGPNFEPREVHVNPGDILRFFSDDDPITFWVYDRYENSSPCLFGGNYTGYCATTTGTELEVKARPNTTFTISLTRPERRDACGRSSEVQHELSIGARNESSTASYEQEGERIALAARGRSTDGTINVG